MKEGAPAAHPCLGVWRVVESSSRFLPVGSTLHLSDAWTAEVRWPDADPAARFQLFDQGQAAGERLVSRFHRVDPHSKVSLTCFFSMVREPRTGQGVGKDIAYGTLIVEGGRGDSSTGTFVAEETDTEEP